MAATKIIRIDPDVYRKIQAGQRPRETLNAALRRLLGLRTKPKPTPGE